jgi:ammonium transporter, Amt family
VTGLLHGDKRQFVTQLLGATLCAVWAFGATYVVFRVVNKVKNMRVSAEVELEGLDVTESGMHAYPEDALVTVSS